MPLTRRAFTALAAGAAFPGIVRAENREPQAVLAGKELERGLGQLFPRGVGTKIVLEVAPLNGPEYVIRRTREGAVIQGATAAGLLYGVLDFLERQGAFFGIDGESYPLDAPASVVLPQENAPWEGRARFAVRGLLPWPDFLNCITVYNEEDFRAYFEAMMRMRFNTFGMHVYTGGQQWAESYLSYEYAGVGHLAFLDSSASHRWGYLPQRTSRFGMGAAQYYDSETFGSDATRLGRDNWEIADRTREMLRKSLDYARKLGMATGVGFEPYQIPDEVWRALPPEVKPENLPGRRTDGARFNVESVAAKQMLEARLAQLLEAYPDVDHVWLWEDEGMNWESRKTGIPLSVTPFMQAHAFLKRHAPKKKLVLSGWGGVARHFEYFHQKLPGDVVFSCLSDSLGWDPIHDVFGKMPGREKWPIPWLEDDPAMWLPQFHTHRFQRDLDLAEQYGCQGMIGIHWRHRIVDPTAGYMARKSWEKGLEPAAFYASYAKTQASGARAAALARVLTATDKDGTLLSTGTRERKDGHVVTREYSGDYGEAFAFWAKYEPDALVVASQKQVAAEMGALVEAAGSPYEREKTGYLAGHVEFLAPYTEAWLLAHRIQAVLDTKDKARVQAEAVPLWLKLAPEVRKAMLKFQSIVATRNDLGTLSSMQNKFVRLALHRLPLSIQEYLGEMPAEMEAARKAALAPVENEAPRLIVPTRPSMLGAGEKVRVMAIVTGAAAPGAVTLHAKVAGKWVESAFRLMGRRTYEAMLQGAVTEYYVSARSGGTKLASPADAPVHSYKVTRW